MDGLCRRSDWLDKPAGSVCRACGHSSLVHPGVNPGLAVCVICELVFVQQQFHELVTTLEAAAQARGHTDQTEDDRP